MDLGIYLGVPLIHGRVKHNHFHSLLERTDSRLTGWKIKLLSKAAHMVLLSSTLMTLPTYTMQTVKLPRTVLNHLDRRCRNFFWGHDDQTRKMHTVAWEKLCLPKVMGGLGFPRLGVVNQVMLAKLLWRMIKFPAVFSNSILTRKYGGWPTLHRGFKVPSASHILSSWIFPSGLCLPPASSLPALSVFGSCFRSSTDASHGSRYGDSMAHKERPFYFGRVCIKRY